MSPTLRARKPGQIFVAVLMIFTIFWIALYIGSHLTVGNKKSFAQIDLSQTYRITPQGEFILFDANTIAWAISDNIATPILERLGQRTEKIRSLMEKVQSDTENLAVNLLQESKQHELKKEPSIEQINHAITAVNCHPYQTGKQPTTNALCDIWLLPIRSLATLSDNLAQLPDFTRSTSIARKLALNLSNLRQQTLSQFQDIKALRPSHARSFFWSSSVGLSLEIIFFAVFGVLANLLVNSAEYLRHGNFKQGEVWVAYTKLIYGPILAWILLTAVAVGWFNLGNYELGLHSFPLFAFVLGFYSRKTVGLFDQLGKKIFGQAEQSIEKGPADIIASRRAYQQQFVSSLKPRNFKELKANATNISHEIVKTIVHERELKK